MSEPRKKTVTIEMEICDSCEKTTLATLRYGKMWLCTKCYDEHEKQDSYDDLMNRCIEQ